MPFERDTSVSIRENILEHIRARFVDARADENGGIITWEKVMRAPLPEPKHIPKSAISILDPKETKRDNIGATSCTLIVSIEFVVRIQLGEAASGRLNRLLLDVQRTMLRDQQCRYLDPANTSRQLSINMSEGRSELDIEGPADRLVGGVVFWEVQYRHAPDDPSKLYRGE